MSQYDAPQQPGYPQQGYQQPAPQQGLAYPAPQSYAPQQPANPLATTSFIAALVSPAAWALSFVPVIGTILAILAPLSAVLAVVFGHIALSQIKKRGQGGRGLALAGVIIGYILIGVSIIMFVFIFAVFGFLLGGLGMAGAF